MAGKKASEGRVYLLSCIAFYSLFSNLLLFVLLINLGIKQEDGKYKHTVDLPKTAFGMRANSSVREPEIQKIWEENQVFKKVVEKNSGVSFGLSSQLLFLPVI